MKKLNWGFIGTGWVADVCAADLEIAGLNKHAVTARDAAKTAEFAAKHNFKHAYSSLDEMLADPEVDVVYIASLNQVHHEHLLGALNAGKHILVEKPFTVNAKQAKEVIDLAREKGLFLLEAMWVPHLPTFKAIDRAIADGLIGELQTVSIDLSLFQLEKDGYGRMWHRATGGGTLLDLGIYPLHYISRLLGPKPESITAVAQLTVGETDEDRVDEDSNAILHFPGRKTGVLHSTMSAYGWNSAAILGSKGRIEIPCEWWQSRKFKAMDQANSVLIDYDEDFEGSGRQFQFIEVERCINAGLTESPVLPLDHTLQVMQNMDEIRRQIGVKYQWD